jgi:4-diphosphocytidyl-2-C-methyl-D-erythritol kinase
MRVLTNCKVNLFLKLLGRRPDGYHELETILHTIGLSDEMEILPTETGDIEVQMSFAEGVTGDLPSREENTVYRAARALLERGARNEGILIRVLKHIPVSAGLGGGSGNAAGALVALRDLWGLELSRGEMLEIASTIGSDVPYCIQGGTTLASGRGEILTSLTEALAGWFVLGISERPLSTANVYAEWDEGSARAEMNPAAISLALGAGDLEEVASLFHNDLEIPAFKMRPELPAGKQALLDAGATGALLSGSGPTVFGLCADEEQARAVAARVEPAFDRVEIAPSRGRCVEVQAEAPL